MLKYILMHRSSLNCDQITIFWFIKCQIVLKILQLANLAPNYRQIASLGFFILKLCLNCFRMIILEKKMYLKFFDRFILEQINLKLLKFHAIYIKATKRKYIKTQISLQQPKLRNF